MSLAEVDRDVALPAVSFTQRFVERRADEHAPTLGHGRLKGRWQLFGRQPSWGLGILFAFLHAQVQGAVFIHLYEHVLNKVSGPVPGTGPRSQLNKLGDNDLCCVGVETLNHLQCSLHVPYVTHRMHAILRRK